MQARQSPSGTEPRVDRSLSRDIQPGPVVMDSGPALRRPGM